MRQVFARQITKKKTLKYANRDEREGPEIRSPFLRACPEQKKIENKSEIRYHRCHYTHFLL